MDSSKPEIKKVLILSQNKSFSYVSGNGSL